MSASSSERLILANYFIWKRFKATRAWLPDKPTWKTARKRIWQLNRLSSNLQSTTIINQIISSYLIIINLTMINNDIISPDAVKAAKFSEANFGLLPAKLPPNKTYFFHRMKMFCEPKCLKG